MIKKTWKDLKHGDFVLTPDKEELRIIDVLPNSFYHSHGEEHQRGGWISHTNAEMFGWQIVQGEEEIKVDQNKQPSEADARTALMELEYAVLRLSEKLAMLRTQYPHLFN